MSSSHSITAGPSYNSSDALAKLFTASVLCRVSAHELSINLRRRVRLTLAEAMSHDSGSEVQRYVLLQQDRANGIPISKNIVRLKGVSLVRSSTHSSVKDERYW